MTRLPTAVRRRRRVHAAARAPPVRGGILATRRRTLLTKQTDLVPFSAPLVTRRTRVPPHAFVVERDAVAAVARVVVVVRAASVRRATGVERTRGRAPTTRAANSFGFGFGFGPPVVAGGWTLLAFRRTASRRSTAVGSRASTASRRCPRSGAPRVTESAVAVAAAVVGSRSCRWASAALPSRESYSSCPPGCDFCFCCCSSSAATRRAASARFLAAAPSPSRPPTLAVTGRPPFRARTAPKLATSADQYSSNTTKLLFCRAYDLRLWCLARNAMSFGDGLSYASRRGVPTFTFKKCVEQKRAPSAALRGFVHVKVQDAARFHLLDASAGGFGDEEPLGTNLEDAE